MSKNSSTTSCDWLIKQLPGLSQEEQSRLQNCGIQTTAALLKQGRTLEDKVVLANKLQIHLQYVHKWVALADLARVPSVGTQYCGLLLHAGIGSVAQLAQTPTHRLHQQILRLQVATMQRRDLCPTIDQVQQWRQQAQLVRGGGEMGRWGGVGGVGSVGGGGGVGGGEVGRWGRCGRWGGGEVGRWGGGEVWGVWGVWGDA